ncbi:MAG: translation elongation factor Ts [Phycisphaerales bacterium]
MSDISAKVVMMLRNKTGLPMMACKEALAEAGGDADKAEELLRKKLKGKMESRSDRPAGEGRVGIAVNEGAGAGAIVEVRCETDFTAKNEKFIKAVNDIAKMALMAAGGEVGVTPDMTAILDDLRASTGENISYTRGHKISGETGTTAFGQYVHHDGKTGVLIQAEGSINDETLRQICMHVTAATPRPVGVTADDIPAEIVEKERRFRVEQAIESGKPKEIAEKMVEGGMKKFYGEIALMEQPFVMDPAKTIGDLVGAKARLITFFRWQVGETA